MLSLPLILAVCSAGLVGGVHCLGMCGSLNWLLQQQLQQAPAQQHAIQFVSKAELNTNSTWIAEIKDWNLSANPGLILLHAGRISCYMLIGAIFGGFGALSLSWKSSLPINTIWAVAGNLSLILMALNLLGWRLPTFISRLGRDLFHHLVPAKLTNLTQLVNRSPFVSGLLWGLLPCGLLYMVAPFAIFSGSAWSGALLMLLFAICALPHLLLASVLKQSARRWTYLRYILAMILLGLGVFGLYFYDMSTMPDFLCITPA